MRPGQPVLISDHLNLTAASPIVGANFVDLDPGVTQINFENGAPHIRELLAEHNLFYTLGENIGSPRCTLRRLRRRRERGGGGSSSIITLC